ncbi:hypothetical protein QAD02_015715 [Eretmocerus hayati]|uniref:Uncharacterized protein n=1 Tax=Eretmocerus hayati TaxID=131215 RepID=A0ACC2P937_9HYME|nr:hypothetical protein QAD02_015715 [Eretmocerus hayati]
MSDLSRLNQLDPLQEAKVGADKSVKKSIDFREQGNSVFRKKTHDETDHKRVLYYYNKSIAYAPPCSEELALAYSNRAVLWIHVKKYDLCLVDVTRADTITKSDELKKKLLLPSLHCMAHNQDLFSSQSMATRIMDIFDKTEGLSAVVQDATELDRTGAMDLETLLYNNKVSCKKFRSLYNLSSYEGVEIDRPATKESIFNKVARISQRNSFTFRTSTACLPPAGSTFCDCKNFESCMQNNCQERGDILGVCSSLINHGCDPNVVRMFLPGPKIVLISFQPIKKGEQIRIFYGPVGARIDKRTRQAFLQKNYSFICDCRVCEENWSPDPMMPDSSKMLLMQQEMVKTFGQQGPLFFQPPHNWIFNEKNLQSAIKMCEFIYETFDARVAYWLNNSLFGIYIICCFHKLYGEDVDFPISCDS